MKHSAGTQMAPLQLYTSRPRNDSWTTITTATSGKESGRSQDSRAGHITPPLTPAASTEDLTSYNLPDQARFHNYLRATYPFYPPCDNFGSSVTLPLNQGDLVLIHSVHVNGWADGTLLASSKRGWLPTNYCEAYHPTPMSRLMNALTVFYDMILACDEAGSLEALCNQDYMRGLVAGVRYLFEVTDCLNRKSPMIAPETGVAVLRRHRKYVLTELSHLVNLAKEVNAYIQGLAQTSTDSDILERMLSTGFTMALRAAKFHEVWLDQHYSAPPPTPPADVTTFAREDRGSPVSSCSGPSTEADAQNALSSASTPSQQENPLQSSRIDHSHVQNQCAAKEARKATPSLSIRTTWQPVSHRVSWAAKPVSARNSKLASSRLVNTHETFLSLLEVFSAGQLISRSANEILVATRSILQAGRALMTVVDAVWDRSQRSAEQLDQVRDEMYRKIADFVGSARNIFQPSDHPDGEDYQPQDMYNLADAATDCVRVAGKCVASTRNALELVGDFEFELLDSSLSESINSESPQKCSNVDTAPGLHNGSAPDTSLHTGKEPEPSARLPVRASRLNRELPPTPSQTDSHISVVTEGDAFTTISSVPSSAIPTPQSSFGATADTQCDSLPAAPADCTDTAPGTSSTISIDTFESRARDSQGSTISITSTTATSIEVPHTSTDTNMPESSPAHEQANMDEDYDDCDTTVLEQSHAHELVFNNDGQVMGGSLPALVERLTTHDSTPDATFVNTFYLTFRLFVGPVDLTQALISRFENVDENPATADPIKLRVYNVFKGWLESHWRKESDGPSLELITQFAKVQLASTSPASSIRLLQLADQVANADAPLVPRLVSSIGKASGGQYIPADKPAPASMLPRSQNTLLRTWKSGGIKPNVVDFEPLEVARQLTIKESKMFCAIQPEELVGCTWSKNPSVAPNVLALSSFSTDLTHLVMDTIMQPQEPNKRARVLKHWVKICVKLLDFKNYDSLIAIMCGIDFSIIDRLKRTWEALSNKTKSSLEQLRASVDISKNYKSLRIQVAESVAPCLPFMGMYLTDLTMTKEAFPDTRSLSSSSVDGSAEVINFEKHSKTAKIIAEVQRLQVPYNFTELPDLQSWMQEELVRMRFGSKETVQRHLYKRSLAVEPRESAKKHGGASGIPVPQSGSREKVDFFSLVLGKTASAS